MFANLTGWHLIVILAVVLLLFGATRLPALSKSVGQSMRIFRNETKGLSDIQGSAEAAPTTEDVSHIKATVAGTGSKAVFIQDATHFPPHLTDETGIRP